VGLLFEFEKPCQAIVLSFQAFETHLTLLRGYPVAETVAEFDFELEKSFPAVFHKGQEFEIFQKSVRVARQL
jgi:hypothetical protein